MLQNKAEDCARHLLAKNKPQLHPNYNATQSQKKKRELFVRALSWGHSSDLIIGTPMPHSTSRLHGHILRHLLVHTVLVILPVPTDELLDPLLQRSGGCIAQLP